MLELTNKIEKTLNHANVDHADRRKVISGAVVLAVAYSLPLPSGEIATLQKYYDDTIKPIVKEKVAKINESVVVDVPTVMEATWNLWKSRYRAVYSVGSSEARALATLCFNNTSAGKTIDADMKVISRLGDQLDAFLSARK